MPGTVRRCSGPAPTISPDAATTTPARRRPYPSPPDDAESSSPPFTPAGPYDRGKGTPLNEWVVVTDRARWPELAAEALVFVRG